MKKLFVAALCGAAFFGFNSTAVTAGETLTSKQIKQFIPGRAKGNIAGSKVTLHMSGSGRLSGKWDGELDSGIWKVANDQLCIKFNKWLGGSMRCSAVTRSGNSYRLAGYTFSKF